MNAADISIDVIEKMSERQLKHAFLILSSVDRCDHETRIMDMLLDEMNIRRELKNL